MASYQPSIPIDYNGCPFDSLLELKFALMIEGKCSYILHPLKIPSRQFDPKKIYLTDHTKFYTPDFLVRKWTSNEAFLVEIKPSNSFVNEPQTQRKRKIAEDYIKLKNYDWSFKFIIETDIKLSEKKEKIFRQLNNRKQKTYMIRNPRFNRTVGESWKYYIPQNTGLALSEKQYKQYVRQGALPYDGKFIDSFIISDDIRYNTQRARQNE